MRRLCNNNNNNKSEKIDDRKYFRLIDTNTPNRDGANIIHLAPI